MFLVQEPNYPLAFSGFTFFGHKKGSQQTLMPGDGRRTSPNQAHEWSCQAKAGGLKCLPTSLLLRKGQTIMEWLRSHLSVSLHFQNCWKVCCQHHLVRKHPPNCCGSSMDAYHGASSRSEGYASEQSSPPKRKSLERHQAVDTGKNKMALSQTRRT